MKIIECPRDAMQGLHDFIPTKDKVAYINQLLKVGFDTIDFGSFVSPKAIPQMRDTSQVLKELDWEASTSGLLAIVANLRGAQEAAATNGAIQYLGFPLSLSETFQIKNTNRTIEQAMATVEDIQNLCNKQGFRLVIYLSMGFGNPYGDPYDKETVINFVEKMAALEIGVISLSDTIGVSTPKLITYLFRSLIPAFPEIEFGAHLHSTPATALEKIAAAFEAGCRRFDGALKGYGGCPMAKNDLVGNMATETALAYLQSQGVETPIDVQAMNKAMVMLDRIFPK